MGVAGCIRCIRADTACYIKLFDVAIQLMYRADTSKTVAKLGNQPTDNGIVTCQLGL